MILLKFLRFLFIFIALIILTPIYSHAQKSKADDLFEAANQWVEKGDAQKAIKGYLNARAEYLKEQNYKRALTCTQNVAYYYQDTGDGPAAEKLFLETISAIPKSTQQQLEVHASLQDNLAYTYLYVLGKTDAALTSYSASIQLYEKAGLANTSKQAFELVNRASVYFQLSQFDLCAADLKRSIDIYEKDDTTTPARISECYGTLGNAYREMGKPDDAQQALEQAYQLVLNSEERELQAKYLNDLGIVLNAKDQYTEALVKYQAAAAINEQLFGKDADHFAQNLINMGAAYNDMGDLDKAMEMFQEVIAIYQQTPPQESSDLTDVLIIISRITDDLGKFEESQKLLTAAMDLTIASYGENSLMQADMYMSLASAAFNRSEFDQSLTYNFKALSILQANKYPESADYAMIYSNVGLAYDELKDIDLALKYKTQALELYKKLYGPVNVSVAKLTGDIGLSYEMIEEYDRAIEYLKKSLDIRLKTQPLTHDDVGTTYLNIGLMYLKLLQPKACIEFLDKARLIYDPYQKNVNKAMIYNRLAFAYDLLNDQQKAKQYTQQAIIANTFAFDNTDFEVNPQQPDFLDFYELNLSYIKKVDYYTKLGDKTSLLKGEKLLKACDEIIRTKAMDVKNEKDRLALSQLNSFYTEAAMLLTDKFYQVTKDPAVLEKAYYYSERSKANELLADIQTSKAVAISGVPKKMLERRTALTKRMNTLHQQLASAYGAKNQELITKLKSQELDHTKEYETLQTEISAVAPNFGLITNERSIPSWNDLRKTLDDKTAIVSYTITDSAKYILIGTNSKLILKSIPPKTNLEKLVRVYINQIKYQSSSMKQMAGQLTDIVWTPVESAFSELGPIEKVIIIPEGPLNYLPFESLGKDRYLLEKYTIRYQFSGALLVTAGQAKEKAKPSLIAMAPVFEDKATNFVNKSCERFVKSSVKADSTSRAFTLDGQYISPLPATEVEVERINQIQQDKGNLSKSFVKEYANEELIKKGELATYDYIHFATHGFVNTQYPELSGLLLSQNAKSQEDGILYTGEILGLNLKANLVTLSACETALGKKIEGEGVRGLTTSFLFAGARNVVASLWKVADESTSTLMITFYDELLSGKDKATALRVAKQRLLADEKYKHPYYWAPFIQVGGN